MEMERRGRGGSAGGADSEIVVGVSSLLEFGSVCIPSSSSTSIGSGGGGWMGENGLTLFLFLNPQITCLLKSH